MKKITTIAVIFLLILNNISIAQGGRGSKAENQKAYEGRISGKVLDSQTNHPLPYTNIILNNQRDSSFVTGTIAIDDGSFILENVPDGNFYIEVKFMGYEEKIISDISISAEKRNISVETIKTWENPQLLGEVQVAA